MLQAHADNLKLKKWQGAQQFNIFRHVCKSKSSESTSMQQQLDDAKLSLQKKNVIT